MRRLALALCATLLATACSAEPTSTGANAAPASNPAPQAMPAAATAERPAETQAVQVAQAGRQAAGDARFVAGRNYRVLNPAQPTSVPPGKVEVVDVFWYGCPGCYAMAPYIARWRETKPEAAVYVRLPAAFSAGWQPHSRLYLATKALGIEEQTHGAIFREYHVNRNPLNTPDLMVQFLTRFGVSEDQARDALASFSVDAELRAADVRVRRFQLNAVPAFVVNGKYVFGVDQAGGPDAVPELINYLVAKEAGTQ